MGSSEEKIKEMESMIQEAKIEEIKRKKQETGGAPTFKPCGPQTQFGYYENIDKN